jgi:hypothetical protein
MHNHTRSKPLCDVLNDTPLKGVSNFVWLFIETIRRNGELIVYQ